MGVESSKNKGLDVINLTAQFARMEQGMRLLLAAFTLDEDHPSLAWQASVARELADRVDRLLVLTSKVGRFEGIPENLDIIVPPIRPMGIPQRFGGRWALNKDVYGLCKAQNINAVFLHMEKEWAYQLKPAFALLRLPVVMWYAHGAVTRGLRLAIACAGRVVTSTPEGCRVDSRKIRVIGQAIDTERFRPPQKRTLENVIYVGRISPRKRVDLLYRIIKALKRLNQGESSIKCQIIGTSRSRDDLEYEYALRSGVWQDHMENEFRMIGLVPHERIPEFYEKAFLHINVSETGSMDKSVMESLASGCPVLTSNPAFKGTLRSFPEFLIEDERPEAVAEQINYIHARRHDYSPSQLRNLVEHRHRLNSYADRVLAVIREIT